MPGLFHKIPECRKIIQSICLILVVLYGAPVMAQQLPQFSQYFNNEFLVNPSVAGYDGRTVFNLSARKQWVGFTDFSPSSYLFSIQGRLLKHGVNVKNGGKTLRKSTKGRVGLGGIVYHDLNGAIERTGGQFSYAYHIFINNSQLSFGLTGNVFQYRINSERAELKYPDSDPLNSLIGKSTLVPDANIGINYLTEKYHIGFSICQLFQSKLKIGNNANFSSSEETRLLRHYYIIADYTLGSRIQSKWEWRPALMFLTNEKFNMQGELTIKAYYNQQYWFGLAGRTTGDIVAMAGIKFRNYYFGYSYDYGFNGISRYAYGSHEICLMAKFGDSARRYRWIERY